MFLILSEVYTLNGRILPPRSENSFEVKMRKTNKQINLDITIIIALKSQQYMNRHTVSVVLKFYEGRKQIGKKILKSLLRWCQH